MLQLSRTTIYLQKLSSYLEFRHIVSHITTHACLYCFLNRTTRSLLCMCFICLRLFPSSGIICFATDDCNHNFDLTFVTSTFFPMLSITLTCFLIGILQQNSNQPELTWPMNRDIGSYSQKNIWRVLHQEGLTSLVYFGCNEMDMYIWIGLQH